jgi:large subunit ribosomal protein L25
MAVTVAAKKRKELAKALLTAEMRNSESEFGKRESRALRLEGWVPGRIQTRDGSVLGVKFVYDDIKKIAFDRFLKNTVFTVNIKDQEPIRCLVRELQIDPVDDDDLTHIQLLKYEPEHAQTVIVEVPFQVVNQEKSPGVKKGGLLNVVMPKVIPPPSCPPSPTPHCGARQ